MAATYKQFLASPNSSLLADRATLHYVTSTTSISGPAEIIKHLNTLQKQVKKKKEDVLNLVDGQTAIAVEVDTTLEFQTSGGTYLPGLDDNFLSDRVVYLPITHFVTFDDQGKILQIRQQWDQGSLLKQLEIIGKSGRNWPIRDSREQLAMIQSCLKQAGHVAAKPSQNEVTIRTRGNSSNATRDPHASLHLMGSREEIEAEAAAATVSPYAGRHRPTQRSFTDILGDEPAEPTSPTTARQRAMSPTKGGSGKNYGPMRLFEGQEDADNEPTPKGRSEQYIRPNPGKYSHFDFADGSDPQDGPQRGVALDEKPKSKHDSQWSFNDFVTPAKPKSTKPVRAQDVRHWDTEKGDDEEAHPAGKGGRRDAETHFELQDDGDRVERDDRPVRPRGSTHNEGLGLYKDNVVANEAATPGPDRALGNITNLGGRGKDFGPHFAMEDNSPSQQTASAQQPVPEAHKKAVKMMDANWSSYDQSPTLKENKPKSTDTAKPGDGTRINIAGNGMGGRKGTGRDFLFGNDDDEAVPKPTGRKGGRGPPAPTNNLWDF